jgi:hypothetical protein
MLRSRAAHKLACLVQEGRLDNHEIKTHLNALSEVVWEAEGLCRKFWRVDALG